MADAHEKDLIRRLKQARRFRAKNEGKLRKQLAAYRKRGKKGYGKGSKPSSGKASPGRKNVLQKAQAQARRGKSPAVNALKKLNKKKAKKNYKLSPAEARHRKKLIKKIRGKKAGGKGGKGSSGGSAPSSGGSAPSSGGGGKAPQTTRSAPQATLPDFLSGGSNSSVDAIEFEEFKPMNIRKMYVPAAREILRQRRMADARKQAQDADYQRFNDWFRGERERATQILTDTHGKTTAAADAAGQRSQDQFKEYVQAASKAIGGNAQLMQDAGINATMAQQAERDRQSQAEVEANRKGENAQTERMDDERRIAEAAARQWIETNAAQHNTTQNQLNEQSSALQSEMAQAEAAEKQRVQTLNLQARQAAQQAAIDRQLADFTNNYQLAKLGLEADKVNIDADIRRESNDIKRLVEQGKMNRARAERALTARFKKLGLASKEADRQVRIALGSAKNSGQLKTDMRDAVRDVIDTLPATMGKEFKDLGYEGGPQSRAAAARLAVSAVMDANPNASWPQVKNAIAAFMGTSLASDTRVRQYYQQTYGGR